MTAGRFSLSALTLTHLNFNRSSADRHLRTVTDGNSASQRESSRFSRMIKKRVSSAQPAARTNTERGDFQTLQDPEIFTLDWQGGCLKRRLRFFLSHADSHSPVFALILVESIDFISELAGHRLH